MINIFLDYYGESIQSQMWQLNEAMKKILLRLSIENDEANQNGNQQNQQHPPLRLRNLQGGLLRAPQNQAQAVAGPIGRAAARPFGQGAAGPIGQAAAIQFGQGAFRLGARQANQDQKSKVEPIAVFNVIKRLMKIENFDLNCNSHYYTLLIYACNVNNKELTKMLIESNKIDVNMYEYQNGNTPLMIAVEKQNEDVAKLLIETPQTNINKTNYNKETALTIAVSKRNLTIVSLLLSCPRFNRIESRLDYAFFISTGEIANFLYSIDGLDVNYKQIKLDKITNNEIYKTSLIYAVEKKDLTTIQMIMNHKTFNRNKSLVTTALFAATKTNDVSIFNELLPLVDNDVNIMLDENESLLTYSAMNKSQNIISEILNQDIFDAKKSDLITAFIKTFHANIDNNNNVHVDINIQADFDSMQMIYNYDQQHDHLIDFSNLLPNGNSFFTSINFAFSNISDVVNFFIEKDVDPDKPDQNGVYPLQHAIQNVKSVPFVQLLLRTNKIDLNRKLKISEQVRAGLLGNDSSFILRKNSLNSKITYKTVFRYDVTYLHLAAQVKEQQEIFGTLKNLNIIDINAEDGCGETPLFYAVKYGNTVLVQNLFMLDDLDYKHKNKDGMNVLKLAKKSQLSNQEDHVKTKGEYLAKLMSILEKSGKLN